MTGISSARFASLGRASASAAKAGSRARIGQDSAASPRRDRGRAAASAAPPRRWPRPGRAACGSRPAARLPSGPTGRCRGQQEISAGRAARRELDRRREIAQQRRHRRRRHVGEAKHLALGKRPPARGCRSAPRSRPRAGSAARRRSAPAAPSRSGSASAACRAGPGSAAHVAATVEFVGARLRIVAVLDRDLGRSGLLVPQRRIAEIDAAASCIAATKSSIVTAWLSWRAIYAIHAAAEARPARAASGSCARLRRPFCRPSRCRNCRSAI